MIITLDGPAGSGKSTISKQIAGKLGINFLDTGATYRCVTLLILEQGVGLDDTDAIRNILASIQIDFKQDKVLLNGLDRTQDIRSPRVDHLVSPVSRLQIVRDSMTRLQRQIASRGDFIAEGRDMGTAVFPQAEYKFYLDADIKERARRRYVQQQSGTGPSLSLAEIEEEIRRRDRIDSTREVAPLKPAQDAVIIDTSSMSIDQVSTLILSYIK